MILDETEIYQRELLQMRLALTLRTVLQLIEGRDIQGALDLLEELGPYAIPLLIKLIGKVTPTVLNELLSEVTSMLLAYPTSVQFTDALIRIAVAEHDSPSPAVKPA